MKKIIFIICLATVANCLSAQITVAPIEKDLISTKKFDFGLQSSFFTNARSYNSFQVGLFGEYRFSENWSLNTTYSFDKTYFDYSNLLNEADKNEISYLEFAASLKYRFGMKKLWNTSLGVYRKFEIANSDPITNSENINGLQLGIGREFILTEKSKLNLEFLIRNNARAGLNYGIRMAINL